VFPCLNSKLLPLKENALYSVALLAVNDLAFGQTNFKLIVNTSISGQSDKILNIVLQFLFDWIIVHGLEALNEGDVNTFKVAREFD
jgi:hypothetical protein